MLNSAYWAESDIDDLSSIEFKSSYGAIIEDLKIDEGAVNFNFLFLYRRLLYAGIIVFFINYPYFQLIIISVILISVFFL